MLRCKIKKQEKSVYNTKCYSGCVILEIKDNLLFNYKRRLAEMGFVENTIITVLRKSMQGKTLLVAIRGYVVSLRKEIAENIIVGEL